MSYHEMIFHSLAGVEEVKMEPLDYMESGKNHNTIWIGVFLKILDFPKQQKYNQILKVGYTVLKGREGV